MIETKVLEEGESTFKNGAGSMCGGVVSESTFLSDPWAYMMAFYMPDDKFKEYKYLRGIKQAWAERDAKQFFKKHARSAI